MIYDNKWLQGVLSITNQPPTPDWLNYESCSPVDTSRASDGYNSTHSTGWPCCIVITLLPDRMSNTFTVWSYEPATETTIMQTSTTLQNITFTIILINIHYHLNLGLVGFLCFWKSLLLTEAAFIWSKIQ